MFIAYSRLLSESRMMQCAGLALAVMLAVCAPALAAERLPEHARPPEHPHAPEHARPTEHARPPERPRSTERVCLTAAQAREKITLFKLADPFRVMQTLAHRFQAEALRVKLCRRKDEFIYEISLLRRDGRVIHAFVNAANGKIIRAINAK